MDTWRPLIPGLSPYSFSFPRADGALFCLPGCGTSPNPKSMEAWRSFASSSLCLRTCRRCRMKNKTAAPITGMLFQIRCEAGRSSFYLRNTENDGHSKGRRADGFLAGTGATAACRTRRRSGCSCIARLYDAVWNSDMHYCIHSSHDLRSASRHPNNICNSVLHVSGGKQPRCQLDERRQRSLKDGSSWPFCEGRCDWFWMQLVIKAIKLVDRVD